MNIILKRLNEHEISLKWDNPDSQPTTIELLAQNAESAILLHETTKACCIIRPDNFPRPLYRVTCGSHYGICSERILPLEGAYNFRDAGGYETEDGMRVRYGKLFRSDHLHRLTDRDLAYLRSTRIRINIDYRKPAEAEKQPDRIWDEDVQTVFCTPDASSAELAAKASGDAEKVDYLLQQATRHDSNLVIDGSGHIMEKQYREFVYHPDSIEAWRNMLLLLAQSGEFAVNQHCRGGKDRTGFGIALIHLLLGVRRTSVIQDYMLTNHLRAERNLRRMAQYREQTSNPDVLAFLLSIMETRRSYLEASLDEIICRYGTVDNYIKNGLGITPKMVCLLKDLFLTTEKDLQ